MKFKISNLNLHKSEFKIYFLLFHLYTWNFIRNEFKTGNCVFSIRLNLIVSMLIQNTITVGYFLSIMKTRLVLPNKNIYFKYNQYRVHSFYYAEMGWVEQKSVCHFQDSSPGHYWEGKKNIGLISIVLNLIIIIIFLNFYIFLFSNQTCVSRKFLKKA